mmetsp:Transcript_18751/g.32293  ORF Transcript_18751/g.32293 Transcript_18751/m.32293 type:complete len:363 (-) Transcript_18751:442-1530(-)|eukprot:CAMPEP_0196656916 /NCGR_PEP_ID=MMETSP1086-20130531/20373_1 /TAXON_ID=77921 /ORGANISM="Cyanoptyche  gloeocystis , Strain SAG4.97" /LENGTH=362 /DNA_ID=CAMNT_0041989845 /DNA_START=156 /DNA_END=1244 /DNA_ORIENTATION=-
MALHFNWPTFDDALLADLKVQINKGINSNPNKPANLADDFLCTDISLGTKAPQIGLLGILDMSEKGLTTEIGFKYDGDAVLKFETKVQANPLANTVTKPTWTWTKSKLGLVSADKPLILPLHLQLTNIHVDGSVIITAPDISSTGLLQHISGGAKPVSKTAPKPAPQPEVPKPPTGSDGSTCSRCQEESRQRLLAIGRNACLPRGGVAPSRYGLLTLPYHRRVCLVPHCSNYVSPSQVLHSGLLSFWKGHNSLGKVHEALSEQGPMIRIRVPKDPIVSIDISSNFDRIGAKAFVAAQFLGSVRGEIDQNLVHPPGGELQIPLKGLLAAQVEGSRATKVLIESALPVPVPRPVDIRVKASLGA